MTARRRLRFLLPVPLLAVSAVVWPIGPEDPPPTSAGEVAYRSLPDLPDGESTPGRTGVEATAIAHAATLKAVPLEPDSEELCPTDRLEVHWDVADVPGGPGDHVSPLGPVPSDDTTKVNGIVVCAGAVWAYMGFEADYVLGRWNVTAVPTLDDEDGKNDDGEGAPAHPTPPPPAAVGGGTFGKDIEGYAAYEPQRTCDSSAKPGTAGLRNLLLSSHPGSRNLGIVRGCSVGGRSEHKEGRAFDWGVNVGRANERAAAESFIAQLLATDVHGNRHALARRMGVMYVIWNRQIWSAYSANAGWRPYSGASAHTDHVHISLSWAGAQGRTSYWSGQVIDLQWAAASQGGSGSERSTRLASGATDDDGERAARRARRVEWETQAAAERTARGADWESHKAAREERRRAARAEWEQARAERRAARQADQQAWSDGRAQRRAEQDAQRQARREDWDRREAEEQARRQQEQQAGHERRSRRWRPPAPTTTVPSVTTTTAPPAPPTMEALPTTTIPEG